MSRLRMAAGAASCIVALFFGGAASAGEARCWQNYEVEAARVRDLQIMLMLGSLKCRSTNSEITAKYDKFYERMGSADKYNSALKLRFMRENGIADGQRAYDDFITRLANSHIDGVQTAGFCQMADTLLTLATNAGENELPMLARNFSEKPAGVGDACELTPAVAAAPAPVPASVPADDVKAAMPVSDPVTPTAAVAETAAPPVTPQSAAAALEAAAVALQSAAASLKTQPGAAGVATKDAATDAQPTLVAVAKPVS
ncbi:hypothetical protein Sphch_1615 [Sphingobium chlorophenolicum L-1]|uniref:Uncharacterized protein n=1 Tax=Sphingobium chlorophenolicum L-1 TaxID=690566 RepID=F6EZH3_SPHCR|nr:hypothetical protein [Sphingobium chlorophenolicum]AEG49303.1 hypothetical protein Sphch_1615 [Sphingobium chlorophenolicum L-1]